MRLYVAALTNIGINFRTSTKTQQFISVNNIKYLIAGVFGIFAGLLSEIDLIRQVVAS